MQNDYTRPEASGYSKQQVFSLAEMVNEKLEFAPGADLYDLVKDLGGEIQVEDTLLDDPEKSGSLFVESANDFKIIISSHTSPKRDRFTIAHELGHLFLHYFWQDRHKTDGRQKMYALRKDSDRVEWEANWFSAAFLMPSAAFKNHFEQFDGDIDEVAEVFDVSTSAAEVRAKSLGLL